MTKQELIRIVQRRLTGDLEKIHPRFIEKYISLAFNQVFYSTFKNNARDLDMYTKSYTCDVQSDNRSLYCDLPVPVVQLPVPGNGVRFIGGEKSDQISFVPLTKRSMMVFDSLPVGKVSKEVGFYIDGTSRVRFDRFMPADIKTLVLDLVRPLESYDLDEDIIIPSGKDEELVMLIIQLLTGTPAPKVVNDNNPQTP